MIDLPTIQLTATGLSMKGNMKATRKNLRARMSAFSSNARPKAMTYWTTTVGDIEHHVAQGVPEVGSAHKVRRFASPLK